MFTEYPDELGRILGVRYRTVCRLEPDRYGFDLPQLLWADEPFDAAVVERELLGRGFHDVSVRWNEPRGPWWARVGGDGPAGEERWIGFIRHGRAGRVGVGRWPHRSQYVVTYKDGWRASGAGTALYDKYDEPHSWVVGLTRHQAELLSFADGRPLPTDAEVAAAVQAVLDARQDSWDRRDRFYAARAARFATEVADLRAEGARLAVSPPVSRHREDSDEGRSRAVAGIPALPVRPGESFPLLRFLVGHFSDRPVHGRFHGAYQVRCNRLALTVADGVTLDLTLHVSMVGGSLWGRPVTPYLPAEADYTGDPGFSSSLALTSTVFPASPVSLTIQGRLEPVPLRWTPLSMVLTFPGGQEYVTEPLRAGAPNVWGIMHRYDGRPVGPEVRLFVPDDINLLKPVRARLIPARG